MAANEDIAIIGMSCIFPGAPDITTYWQNIVSKVDAVGDPPEDWEAGLYYDPDATADGHVYCKRGGYIGDLLKFRPGEFGVMPKAVDGADPDQFVGLMVVKSALENAGYLDKSFDKRRCELIVGRGTYINRGFANQISHCFVVDETIRLLRQLHPEHSEEELERIKQELKDSLPPFSAEIAPGLVPNVMTGRMANRFDLMGTNYTVDAACASSLIAIENGVRDLRSGNCDMALVGGANAATTPPMLMLFCLLNALSRKEQIRPFSASADGTLLGEGFGMVVIKRRSDAERDGDRIYSVIKGVGSSSDGRALSVLAPRMEGEALAISRAFENAAIGPESIGLIEAHGTGTIVGDATEVASLRQVFGERKEGALPYCALGTVKSMISHLIPAAGIAGLIKTALALHHKVLPPTLHCEDPSPELKLETSPFYLNTETRPWVHGLATPRRAGVNAFGFGGVNAHVVLEEVPEPAAGAATQLHDQWDSEVVILEGNNRGSLIDELARLEAFLGGRPSVMLKDIAATYNRRYRASDWCVAFVATDLDDLCEKIGKALHRLADPECERIRNASGIYFAREQLAKQGKLALVFPGEGAQYRNMLADLCLHFPEVRAWFDLMDRAFASHSRGYLPSQIVFPAPELGNKEDDGDDQLFGMDCAVEAVFAANQALAALVQKLGIRPDAVLGHSTGEYSALMVGGAIRFEDDEQLIGHILDLNGIYEQALERGDIPEAVLYTVGATDTESVNSVVAESDGPLFISMDNCPHQVVLCGTPETTARATERLREIGAVCQPLPFNRAYHTPLFSDFCGPLEGFFSRLDVQPPQLPVYTCVTGEPFPSDKEQVRRLAVDQWMSPVRFRQTVEAMHADGVRVFVDAGPRGNLSAFVDDTLRRQPHLAVPINLPNRSGISQLNHMVAQLAAHGVMMKLDYLYARRSAQEVLLETGKDGPVEQRPPIGEMKLSTYVCGGRIAPSSPLLSELKRRTPGHRTLSAGSDAATGVSRPRCIEDSDASPFPVEATPQAGQDTRSPAMAAYFETMEQFLSTQQGILQQVLAGRAAPESPFPPTDGRANPAALTIGNPSPSGSLTPEQEDGAQASAAANDPQTLAVSRSRSGNLAAEDSLRYPLLGTPLSFKSGESLRSRRKLRLDDDLFLLHHTIGSRTVAADPGLTALPVVPLTMTMEIMAEAAAYLVPDKRLVGIREVRGYRWIGLDRSELTLEVDATRQRDAREDRVEVRVFEVPEEQVGNRRLLIMEGQILMADAAPVAPMAARDFAIRDETPSRWHGEIRYRDGMFHGPAFQAVERVDRTGSDGTEATLEVLEPAPLFRDNPNPALVTDPVILDAAGQVVGYWALEHLESGFNVFPFRVEALDIFTETPPAHERVVCRARLTDVTETETRSDIEVIRDDGRLWMRINGWWDRRFDMPLPFYRFRITPLDIVLSRPLPGLVAHLPAPTDSRCFVLDDIPGDLLTTGWMIWARVFAHLILCRNELKQWWSLELEVEERNEWLLKRAVAKDAVRTLVNEKFGLTIYPADIEIVIVDGRPLVQGEWLSRIPLQPGLAWSHAHGVAGALAGFSSRPQELGVSLINKNDFTEEEAAALLSTHDIECIEGISAAQSEHWMTRAVAAKRAAGQALGMSEIADPGHLRIVGIDSAGGVFHVAPTGPLAGTLPTLREVPVSVKSQSKGNFVVATAGIEQSV